MKLRRCTGCGALHGKKRCPNCAMLAREYVRGMPGLRRVVKNGNLTPAQAAAFLLMVREYLAEHWTDRENPRHEIMEAVCHLIAWGRKRERRTKLITQRARSAHARSERYARQHSAKALCFWEARCLR